MSSNFVSGYPRKLLLADVQRVLLMKFERFSKRFSKLEPDLADGASHGVRAVVAIYIAGVCNQLLMVYDTLANRNVIQTISLCIYSAILSVYTIVQWLDLRGYSGFVANTASSAELRGLEALLISQSCLTGLSTLILVGVSWRLSREFRWSILQRLNADLRLQKRYFVLQVSDTSTASTLWQFTGPHSYCRSSSRS